MNAYGRPGLTTTLLSTLLVSLMVFASSVGYASGGRTAVAVEAARSEAPVSAIAARAPYILIFDAEGRLTEAHPNPFATAADEAGPALAHWLADRQVDTLIAGNFGGKLSKAMKDKNIRGIVASGPAAEAIKEAQK